MKKKEIVVEQVEPLSEEERGLLARQEARIGELHSAPGAAGAAIRIIRDKKLYRASAKTFEKYARGKFQIGRAHAYRLIAYADLLDELSPVGDIKPIMEHARVILKLKTKEKRIEAWTKIVHRLEQDGLTIPTAKTVRRAVLDVSPRALTRSFSTVSAKRIHSLSGHPSEVAYYLSTRMDASSLTALATEITNIVTTLKGEAA